MTAKSLLVGLEKETSNSLFDTLEDWNSYLKAENVEIDKLHPQDRANLFAKGLNHE